MTETTTTPAEESRTEQAVRGLRELADWIEANPATHDTIGYSGCTINHCCRDREQFVATLKALGGPWEKSTIGDYFNMERRFGPLIAYHVYVKRSEVCERRVVGTREVTIEAPDPDVVAALPKTLQKVVDEQVEWICPPSVLALAD